MSEKFVASNGVAVLVDEFKTDRGPGFMVDGSRISPNDALALREYFEAEFAKWRPWLEATPGEVWVISTTYYGERAAVVSTTDFENANEGEGPFFIFSDNTGGSDSFEVVSKAIESAHRIFPEVVSDDS